jgi:hypothetical protein
MSVIGVRTAITRNENRIMGGGIEKEVHCYYHN